MDTKTHLTTTNTRTSDTRTSDTRTSDAKSQHDATPVALIDDGELFGVAVFEFDHVCFTCPSCEHEERTMPEFASLYTEVACCGGCGIVLAA